MKRREFLTGTTLAGTGLAAMALSTTGASAAEWTPAERANVDIVNAFIAARVRLRNAKVSIDEWNRTMAQYAIEDLMFTVHPVGRFVPQAKIGAGLGPWTKIEMKIGETFAKGPVVMHERTDFMSYADRPDAVSSFIGIYALKDRKIHEWLEYTI